MRTGQFCDFSGTSFYLAKSNPRLRLLIFWGPVVSESGSTLVKDALATKRKQLYFLKFEYN